MTWAFVPLTPNDEIAARRGRFTSGQSCGSDAMTNFEAPGPACGATVRADGVHGAVDERVHAPRGVDAADLEHRADPAVVRGLLVREAPVLRAAVAVRRVAHAVAPFRSMHAAIIARARCSLFLVASTLAPTSRAIDATGASSR